MGFLTPWLYVDLSKYLNDLIQANARKVLLP